MEDKSPSVSPNSPVAEENEDKEKTLKTFIAAYREMLELWNFVLKDYRNKDKKHGIPKLIKHI